MIWLFIILAFLIVVIAFAWSSDRLGKVTTEQEFVQCVEAGGIEKATTKELADLSFTDVKRSYCDENGNVLDRSLYSRIVVHNNCMIPRNIYDKDQLLVKNVSHPKANQLCPRDILYLKIDKDGEDYYKIRELEEVTKGNELKTRYYDMDGKVHPSSRNHKLEMVQGVVKYNLTR